MGASSSPPYPYPGGTAGAEPPDPVAGSGGHFAWSIWVKQFLKVLDVQALKRGGDTMQGDLTLAGNPTLPMHAVTKQYADTATIPTGMIAMFAVSPPSTGWVLADGRALPTSPEYAALRAHLGSGYVPDLRGQFIRGSSALIPTGSSGGRDKVRLTAAQCSLPQHGHGLTVDSTELVHSHSVDPPSTTSGEAGSHNHNWNTGGMNQNRTHRHTATTWEGITTGDSDKYIDTADAYSPITPRTGTVEIGWADIEHTHGIGWDGNHTHAVDIGAFQSGSSTQSHSHTGSIAASGVISATEDVPTVPPFYAVVLAIKL